MNLQSKLDVPLEDLVAASGGNGGPSGGNDERRPRGGGRFREGKRYSSRQDENKPYTRRNPAAGGGGGGGGGGPSPRVYVGNLAWQTSWQDLKDHMRKAGNVVRADVFLNEVGRSKGCGIVEYSTPEEAQNAIKTLNDTTIDDTDRLIFVREDREERNFSNSIQRGPPPRRAAFGGGAAVPGGYRGAAPGGGGYVPRQNFRAPPAPMPAVNARGRQVFVGNLPYTCSWQDLKDTFRQCGNIIRADVLLDISGRSKGQGTVLFETPAEAQKAIAMFDNTDFQGRVITVHEDKFA